MEGSYWLASWILAGKVRDWAGLVSEGLSDVAGVPVAPVAMVEGLKVVAVAIKEGVCCRKIFPSTEIT